MRLAGLRLINVGPFSDLSLPFADEDGKPRRVVVLHGGPGTAKTLILSAIAHTRPGNVSVPQRRGLGRTDPPCVVADWVLGADDPDRPHPLRVVSPNVRLREGDEDLRRREQQLFNRKAQEGGFVVVGIPAHRWFSRQAVAVTGPRRTVLRYDVRSATSLTDSTRFDLTRETKATLTYAEAAAAVAGDDRWHRDRDPDPRVLRAALRAALEEVLAELDLGFDGLDPVTLEPKFLSAASAPSFDELPTQVKNLVALVVLPIRALFAGRGGADPRTAEGVVLVDNLELYLGPHLEGRILDRLERALPGVQWIVSTSSAHVAASRGAGEVIALRLNPVDEFVDVSLGTEALIH